MTLKMIRVGICVLLFACSVTSMSPISVHERAQIASQQSAIEGAQLNSPEIIIPAIQLSPTTESSKVIIRPASTLTTPKPSKNHRMPENTENGCKCESLDSCPIELMDFSFSVSCGYGTVRCCRPVEPSTEAPMEISDETLVELSVESATSSSLEPTATEESIFTKPVVVSPATTVKFSKKPMSCKCKPRKECDKFFQAEEDVEVFDRKDVLTCSAGMVRCCESGNMGNPKEMTTPRSFKKVQAPQILGNVAFKPVQLPFLTVPTTSNQRVSEQEPQPTDQELKPLDSTPTTASTETASASNNEAPPEKSVKVNRPQIFFPQPVFVPFQQQQQPVMAQQLPQQPAFHHQANMPHHRPITPPVIEAGFRPIISSQGFPNQPHPIQPGQVLGLRPAPPQQGPATLIQSTNPVLPKEQKNATTTTPRATRRPLRPQFGLSVPTPPPSPSPPTAPHVQMRPPIGSVPFQPLPRPPPPPQRSSGFFSSLLGMFS